MQRNTALTALAAGLLTCACTSPDVRPTLSANVALAESWDAEFEGGPSGDTEYSSAEIGFGVTQFAPGETSGVGRDRIGRSELRVGFAEFGQLEAIEVVGGGSFMPFRSGALEPYISAHAVSTILEDVGGADSGTQLGLRLGTGLDLELTEVLYVTAGVDWTLPVIEADPDVGPDFELDGVTFRVGFGLTF